MAFTYYAKTKNSNFVRRFGTKKHRDQWVGEKPEEREVVPESNKNQGRSMAWE